MTLLTTAPNVRFRLKEATEADHRSVDAGFSHLNLETYAGYRTFLEANAAALVPLEAALEHAGVLALLPDWPARTRREAIRADVVALGGRIRPLQAPALPTPGQMWGALYVLEGSRLGGQVLRNAVAASGDPRVLSAMSFLTHGEDGRLWPTFTGHLNAALTSDADVDEAVAGARATFALFKAAQAGNAAHE